MKSVRELETQLEKLEDATDNGALKMKLDDGRHIKINCGDQDGIINLVKGVIQNRNHPYRKYFEHAIEGHPDAGCMVMACKSLMHAVDRSDAV